MAARALVLGGGGLAGIGWEWGVLAGLLEHGIDLRTADVVVGTSAGSVVGSQLAAGLDPDEQYRTQLEPPNGEVAAALGRGTLLRFGLAMIGARSPEQARARIGRIAMRMRSVPEQKRLEVITSRLPVREWPERDLKITAVDAETGAFEVFDRNSAIPLVRAVAASCAVPGVWPPVTINGRRYMDGGIRSAANADLAAGYERVVVLAPLTRGIGPIPKVTAQVAKLRETAQVALVTPDAEALAAFGRNLLDPARRAPAARAGRAQAVTVLDKVAEVWAA